MKKTLALLIASASFIACNDMQNDNAATDDRNEPAIASPAPETEVYTPVDGDVTYRDDKVLVMRNGEWVEADDDVKLDNGVVVYRNGKVEKDGKKVELEDGEIVDRTGNFFDRTGKAIEKGWDHTKEAAKEMGNDVERATEKAGDKIDKTVDDNDYEKNK